MHRPNRTEGYASVYKALTTQIASDGELLSLFGALHNIRMRARARHVHFCTHTHKHAHVRQTDIQTETETRVVAASRNTRLLKSVDVCTVGDTTKI